MTNARIFGVSGSWSAAVLSACIYRIGVVFEVEELQKVVGVNDGREGRIRGSSIVMLQCSPPVRRKECGLMTRKLQRRRYGREEGAIHEISS